MFKFIFCASAALFAFILPAWAQTINIDCGGYQNYTATDGTVWIADKYYTGGEQLYTGYNIAGTNDPKLYATSRVGYYGNFSYTIPISNGQYTVTLKFAESQYWLAGQRVFNVAINGSTVLSNFDVVAQGGYFTAIDRPFSVAVTGGVVQINVAGVVNAGLLSAIQIVPSAGAAPPASLTVSPMTASLSPGQQAKFTALVGDASAPVTWSVSGGGSTPGTVDSTGTYTAPASVSQAITVSVTATSTADTSQSASAQVTVTPSTSSGSASASSINIDCGAYSNSTGPDGTQWAADTFYTGGQQLYTGYPIASAPDQTIYQTARVGYYGGFSYSIPVTNGQYNLILRFADSQYEAAGQRVFNVAVNGAPTLTNFDVVAQAGSSYRAVDQQLPISVTNGTVQLDFTGVVNGPLISAIQITPVGQPVGGNTPLLQVSSSSAQFSATVGGSNPAAQTISITNGGGGTLNWTATKTQSWLALSAASGSAPANISVSVGTGALTAGVYTDVITVNGAAAGASPQTVAVTFTLRAAISTSTANDHYVSTTGSPSGDGSIGNPWDIVTGLAGPPAVKPGDTIWVRGGTYGNGVGVFYSSLVGTASSPIIVRAYPGERATIDNWLQVGCCDQDPHPTEGAYVWFWGLEFASTVTDRTGQPDGPPAYGQSAVLDSVDTWAPGTKFINNIIHDTRMGPSMWKESIGSEAYGNVIYDNGFQASDRGHGHGFYLQNDQPTMLVSDNFSFNNFNEGLQAYGTSAAIVRNITLEGNIFFNNGIISAGQALADNVVFDWGGMSGIQLLDNHMYFTPEYDLGYNQLGGGQSNVDFVAKNNYFMGGFETVYVAGWSSMTFQNNTVLSLDKYEVSLNSNSLSGFSWDNNTYYGSGNFLQNGDGTNFGAWPSWTGFDTHSTFQTGAPTGIWTFVRPNKYEPGRANVLIYNWNMAPTVSVDISAAGLSQGTQFEVLDVQNYYGGPVLTGTYNGSPVTFPMTGLRIAAPVGNVPSPAAHTDARLGTFLILPLQ